MVPLGLNFRELKAERTNFTHPLFQKQSEKKIHLQYSRAESVQWRIDVGSPHPTTVAALMRIKYSLKG